MTVAGHFVSCFKCSHQIQFVDRLSFFAECEKCGEDAHVCRNCLFFDPKAYNECREPQAEVVREKDRANRCEYFQAKQGSGPVVDPKEALLSAAEALFKKK